MIKKKKVAVITRTKDREILLWRALNSVSRQTFQDIVWVIVNDGGKKEGVDAVAETARGRGIDVHVLHHEKSKGMEAASNAGIRSCDSDYIVIHDDDDSWEPDFLKRTVAFLDSEPLFAGVITHTLLVNEVIENNLPRTTSSHGFNTWLKSIYLMEMLMVNTFPPISFLYKRSVYNEIGGYNESLPVLGDWDFNIRFLQKANIGVIPELLALYHHRDTITDPSNVYGNTVNAGVQNHVRYDALLRNYSLQSDSSKLGILANLAMVINWQNSKLDGIAAQLNSKIESFSAVENSRFESLAAQLNSKLDRIADQQNSKLDSFFARQKSSGFFHFFQALKQKFRSAPDVKKTNEIETEK